jgi:OPA family glycerol-3-phosphate transporter-like MFS transporter
MNAGLTAIRETFKYWTPRYLEKGIGLDSAYAGLLSFVFPFTGAMACLLAGWGADRLRGHYGRLIVPLMGLTTITLVMFVQLDLRDNGPLALTLIGAVALFLMGPYTFCSGVLALNLGGKRSATCAGRLSPVKLRGGWFGPMGLIRCWKCCSG